MLGISKTFFCFKALARYCIKYSEILPSTFLKAVYYIHE